MKIKILLFSIFSLLIFMSSRCINEQSLNNKTALEEQQRTEKNQSQLNKKQPAPIVTWSMERDNLIKRFKLMNDRSVVFYMYVFNYGVAEPIGYYQVNKVSSVNSQLTNPNQIICNETFEAGNYSVMPSPAEDGSYGTNGDAIFGFTPEDIYIEHNMQYMVSTVPLAFSNTLNLANISLEDLEDLKVLMKRLE